MRNRSRIFRRGLVAAGAGPVIPPPLNDASHYWTMNEDPRTDSVGSLDFVTAVVDVPGSVVGKNSWAVAVTDTAYLRTVDPVADPAAFSLTLWYKVPNFNANSDPVEILFKNSLEFNYDLQIIPNAGFTGGKTQWYLGDPVTPLEDPVDRAVNQWHFLAMSFTGSSSRLSVDGDAFVSVAATNTPDPTAYIAVLNGTNGIPVYVDEMAMWDRAITFAEVTTLYNSGAGLFL